ncbi:VOC family protein [Shewanella eurypsychrophilus]|uniref:VOC family protein n=1 Tax=Shewanella eurypsychrophilus TaxID=2593656 RepID=A0ABX6VFX7_9GAMM|nr:MULTISPECIES: VOC family protein [Shewanella]QFU24069.1 glyoxalase [Shewanella sp. YLB-09]QPG59278.1 VOC family protein [Shewanella eurypsychrophilus]
MSVENYYTPKPTRLGHLVLKVKDVQASVKFYQEVVGLSVSDWIDDRMVFMRASADHHDLALLQLPPDQLTQQDPLQSRIEHFSYRVESLEEMKQITEMLLARGVEIDRGLGRHGPGENTFIVFKDPDGNNVEFYSDMLQITQSAPYEASVWDSKVLHTFDQWQLKEFVVEPPERIKEILPE